MLVVLTHCLLGKKTPKTLEMMSGKEGLFQSYKLIAFLGLGNFCNSCKHILLAVSLQSQDLRR